MGKTQIGPKLYRTKMYLVDGDDLPVGPLNLAQLPQEVPAAGFMQSDYMSFCMMQNEGMYDLKLECKE